MESALPFLFGALIAFMYAHRYRRLLAEVEADDGPEPESKVSFSASSLRPVEYERQRVRANPRRGRVSLLLLEGATGALLGAALVSAWLSR